MLSFIFQPNYIKVDIKSIIYKSRIKVQLFSDKYNLQKYASYALSQEAENIFHQIKETGRQELQESKESSQKRGRSNS